MKTQQLEGEDSMTKMHWARGVWAVAAVMVTGIASAALPQQGANEPAGAQAPATQQKQREWTQDRGQHRAMAGHNDLDHFFSKVVIKANKDEIASARIAQQRSTNSEIKKFAAQIADDDTRIVNRLEQSRGTEHGMEQRGAIRDEKPHEMQRGPRILTAGGGWIPSSPAAGVAAQPQKPVETPSTSGEKKDQNASAGQAKSATTAQSQPAAMTQPNQIAQRGATTQPNQAARGQFGGQRMDHNMAEHAGMADHHSAAREFVAIMDEVSERMQQAEQRELSQKEGIAFDRAFLGQQVMSNMWLSEAMSAFQRHASPDLQPILQEGLQVTQQHLTQAKALLMRMEQSQPKSTALQQNERTNAR
jgi:predicted outer membrane protein